MDGVVNEVVQWKRNQLLSSPWFIEWLENHDRELLGSTESEPQKWAEGLARMILQEYSFDPAPLRVIRCGKLILRSFEERQKGVKI